MRIILKLVIAIQGIMLFSCNSETKKNSAKNTIIGNGQMPNAISDESGNVQIAFGTGDSIMFSSSDDKGETFSKPELVSILPGLAASHMRGPQIAATTNGTTVIACDKAGDIFSFYKTNSGKWIEGERVNDADTVAKEGLMALDGDREILFAVWLDLRDGHNKIFGARSDDGGKIWSANKLIYASPDSTVCECCKPSVSVDGVNVYVMFRNWLNGNRDLHLIKSQDGGANFSAVQKLGDSSWALNGCPMDGGGLTVSEKNVHTVFNRKGSIYAYEQGKPERLIGAGRGCTLTTVNGKQVYAWTEKGDVVCLLPLGKTTIGKGKTPVIKAIGNGEVICIWENENAILFQVLDL